MRLPLHTVQSLLLVLLLASPGSACLWDSDTLKTEARGMPEVVDVIVGRFARYPALYYEMRLERVTNELEADPAKLDAYDDAGVACDRLGRHDEAIEWMTRKRQQLDRMDAADPEVKDHEYRYLANLGTFYAHRWIAGGADRQNMQDLQTAIDLIEQAIALNPEAHFGREEFQLRALRWIADPPPLVYGEGLPSFLSVVDTLATEDGQVQMLTSNSLDPAVDPSKAVQGYSGLVALGNAWQSVDVYYALAMSLEGRGRQDQHSSLAYLAQLRVEELIDRGGGSVHPLAPQGRALKEKLYLSPMIRDHEKDFIAEEYTRLRTEADVWHDDRMSYMMTQLNRGEHPDTHPEFWSAYTEPPRPDFRMPRPVAFRLGSWNALQWMIAILVVVLLVEVFKEWRKKNSRQQVD